MINREGWVFLFNGTCQNNVCLARRFAHKALSAVRLGQDNSTHVSYETYGCYDCHVLSTPLSSTKGLPAKGSWSFAVWPNSRTPWSRRTKVSAEVFLAQNSIRHCWTKHWFALPRAESYFSQGDHDRRISLQLNVTHVADIVLVDLTSTIYNNVEQTRNG